MIEFSIIQGTSEWNDLEGCVDQSKGRLISQTQKEAPQDLTTRIPDSSVMEKDTPVSEMPRSEPDVKDQSGETDKTEFASQQHRNNHLLLLLLMHLLYRLHPLPLEDHRESRRLQSDWTFSLTKGRSCGVFIGCEYIRGLRYWN